MSTVSEGTVSEGTVSEGTASEGTVSKLLFNYSKNNKNYITITFSRY
jgi:hypothetical protein